MLWTIYGPYHLRPFFRFSSLFPSHICCYTSTPNPLLQIFSVCVTCHSSSFGISVIFFYHSLCIITYDLSILSVCSTTSWIEFPGLESSFSSSSDGTVASNTSSASQHKTASHPYINLNGLYPVDACTFNLYANNKPSSLLAQWVLAVLSRPPFIISSTNCVFKSISCIVLFHLLISPFTWG